MKYRRFRQQMLNHRINDAFMANDAEISSHISVFDVKIT